MVITKLGGNLGEDFVDILDTDLGEVVCENCEVLLLHLLGCLDSELNLGVDLSKPVAILGTDLGIIIYFICSIALVRVSLIFRLGCGII